MRWKISNRETLIKALALCVAVFSLASCKRAQPRVSDSSQITDAVKQATSPIILANPNPLPAGTGTTTISWNTGDGSEGDVYVSTDGGEEKHFAKNAMRSMEVSWIYPGSTYEFRLYRSPDRTTVLASVKVTRDRQK